MADVEVSTTIAAAPDKVWDLIADPTRMGEWSPECRELAWLSDVATPALGARFSGRNRNGWRRWTTQSTIVTHEQGQEIAWEVRFLGLPVSRWGYQIEALAGKDGGTCRLVEAFSDHRSRASAPLLSLARGVRDVESHNRAGMEHTLARIKAAAETT